MDHQNETFEAQNVVLDGNSYKSCTFRNVVFVYGGGPLHMEDCRMDAFSWQFTGDLANGLFALFQLFGQEGMLTIIRGFTEPGEDVVELQLPERK